MSEPVPNPSSGSSSDPSIARQFGMFAVVITAFLGSSAAGIGIGWLLWKNAGFPWWTIVVTSLVGLFAACLQVVRFQRILQKPENKALKKDSK